MRFQDEVSERLMTVQWQDNVGQEGTKTLAAGLQWCKTAADAVASLLLIQLTACREAQVTYQPSCVKLASLCCHQPAKCPPGSPQHMPQMVTGLLDCRMSAHERSFETQHCGNQ